VLIVANVRDDELPEGGSAAQTLRTYTREHEMPLIVLPGKIEEEITELSAEEQKSYLESYGLSTSGLSNVIAAGYNLLKLVTFYTIVGPEVRAWTVPAGTVAPQAAGKIHTDFEQGFISVEVVSFPVLIRVESWSAAREAGTLHQHGKQYIVRDGDVCHFKFNA